MSSMNQSVSSSCSKGTSQQTSASASASERLVSIAQRSLTFDENFENRPPYDTNSDDDDQTHYQKKKIREEDADCYRTESILTKILEDLTKFNRCPNHELLNVILEILAEKGFKDSIITEMCLKILNYIFNTFYGQSLCLVERFIDVLHKNRQSHYNQHIFQLLEDILTTLSQIKLVFSTHPGFFRSEKILQKLIDIFYTNLRLSSSNNNIPSLLLDYFARTEQKKERLASLWTIYLKSSPKSAAYIETSQWCLSNFYPSIQIVLSLHSNASLNISSDYTLDEFEVRSSNLHSALWSLVHIDTFKYMVPILCRCLNCQNHYLMNIEAIETKLRASKIKHNIDIEAMMYPSGENEPFSHIIAIYLSTLFISQTSDVDDLLTSLKSLYADGNIENFLRLLVVKSCINILKSEGIAQNQEIIRSTVEILNEIISDTQFFSTNQALLLSFSLFSTLIMPHSLGFMTEELLGKFTTLSITREKMDQNILSEFIKIKCCSKRIDLKAGDTKKTQNLSECSIPSHINLNGDKNLDFYLRDLLSDFIGFELALENQNFPLILQHFTLPEDVLNNFTQKLIESKQISQLKSLIECILCNGDEATQNAAISLLLKIFESKNDEKIAQKILLMPIIEQILMHSPIVSLNSVQKAKVRFLSVILQCYFSFREPFHTFTSKIVFKLDASLFKQFGPMNLAKICIISFEDISTSDTTKKSSQIVESISLISMILQSERRTFKRFLKFLVSYSIVLIDDEKCSLLILESISSFLSKNTSKMCLNYMHYIYIEIFKENDIQKITNLLTKLEKLSKINITTMIRCQFQNICNNLLIIFAKNEQLVIAGLSILKSHHISNKSSDKDSSLPMALESCKMSDSELSEFLTSRFLGVLSFFYSFLSGDDDISQEEKLTALKSLCSLLHYIPGKMLKLFAPKIINIFQLFIKDKFKQFHDIIVNCCKLIVDQSQTLNTNYFSMIQLLLHICESNDQKELNAETLKLIKVIIEEMLNSEELQTKLFFFPYHKFPKLSHSYRRMMNIMSQRFNSKCEEWLLLKGIILSWSEDNIEVQVLLLEELKRNLAMENLQIYIKRSEDSNEIVSQLMIKLIALSDVHNMSSLQMQCIGLIGAISPLKISDPDTRHILHKSKSLMLNDEILDNECYLDILNKLYRAFVNNSSLPYQDVIMFSVQELLKILDCSSKTKHDNVFESLSTDVQAVFTPLLNSKFVSSAYEEEPLQSPLMKNPKIKSFKNYSFYLSSKFLSLIKNDSTKRFITATLPMVRYDYEIAKDVLKIACLSYLNELQNIDNDDLLIEELSEIKHIDDSVPSLLFSGIICFYNNLFTTLIESKKSIKIKNYQDCPEIARQIRNIDTLIGNFPKEAFCDANIQLEQFYEALYFIELDYHHRINVEQLDRSTEEYQIYFEKLTLRYEKIYSNIGESDGIMGISSLKSSKKTSISQVQSEMNNVGLRSLLPEITFNKATNNFQCLMDCYKFLDFDENSQELLVRIESKDDSDIKERYLQKFNVDLNSYDHTGFRNVDSSKQWKICKWKSLQLLEENDADHDANANVLLNNAIYWMLQSNETKFHQTCDKFCHNNSEAIQHFKNLPHSYHLCYKYVSYSHMLQILRDCVVIFSETFDLLDVVKFMNFQIGQLDIVLDDYRYKEDYLILFRNIIFTFIDLKPKISTSIKNELLNIVGNLFLDSSGLSLNVCQQISYYNLLKGRYYGAIKFNYYMAQWQWIYGDKFEAEKRLLEFLDESSKFINRKDMKDCIYKAKVLLGNYMEESGSSESNKIIATYRRCHEFNPNVEDAYFYLGRHYEKIKFNLLNSSTTNFEKICDSTYSIIKYYSTSIANGSKFILQSLPPLFTHWMDFDETINSKFSLTDAQIIKSVSYLNKMTQSITYLRKTVNIVTFLPIVPQLISRLTHENSTVYEEIKQILSNVMMIFPQQVIWHLVSQKYSSHKLRSARCQEIIDLVLSTEKKLGKFVEDALQLAKLLLKMCTQKINSVPGKKSYLISEYFPELLTLINSSTFSKIIIPTENQLRLYNMKNIEEKDFVYIAGISPQFTMLHSLMKPKKFAFLGSNGKYYMMLSKPNDDLRKDARLMEINHLLNAFLSIDADSKNRNLHINTYSVVPLNDESGLIQWIEDTSGYGNIVKDIYAQKGIPVSQRQLREKYYHLSTPLATKVNTFTQTIVPMHPDVFYEWFFEQFPDPRQWFKAKLAFIRTFAVMSIVGYILGLGDRHGENILFNSSNGECMHVDFNCLFNKGESLEWPELVPFRLTHNLISAMGPHGYDGFFRVACEKTLKLMRCKKEAIMCILDTFIHDPLLEWSKTRSSSSLNNPKSKKSKLEQSSSMNSARVVYSERNSEAMIHMENCKRRLEGQVWKITGSKKKTATLQSGSLKLSEHGQVDFLIQEATNIDNLAQMFIGWAAYM